MKKILLSLFSIFIFLSCTENNNPPDEEEINFLPLKTGNYWIYDFWELDSEKNKLENTAAIDSMVIVEKKTINFRESYVLNVYRNGVFLEQLIFAKDSWGISKIGDSLTNDIPGLEPTWFRIYHSIQSDWDIYTKYEEGKNLTFNGNNYSATKHYVLKGSKAVAPDYLQVGDFVHSSLANIIKIDRKFSFKYDDTSFTDPANIDIIQLNYERYWFVKNIGLVKAQNDPYTNTTKSDSAYCSYKQNPLVVTHNGWLRTLKKYRVEIDQ